MLERDPMLTSPGTAGNPAQARAFPREGARHHAALLWSVGRRTWCGVWATPFGTVPAFTTRFTPRPKPHVVGPPATLEALPETPEAVSGGTGHGTGERPLTLEELRAQNAVFVAPEWRHLI